MKTKKALAVLLAVVMLVMPLAVSSFAAGEIIASPVKTAYTDAEFFNPQGLEIFDGSNSQKTDDMEYLDTEGTKARYLKLINYGNSEGSKWISLVELEAYGK